MKLKFLLLILCFGSFVCHGQDLESILHNVVWNSSINVINTKKQPEKITLTLSSDTIPLPNKFQIKFLNDNTFYFTWLSDGNYFDESGNIVPAGQRFENSNWSYFINGSMIKIFKMVTYAKTGKTDVITHYYKTVSNSDPNQLEFIAINKKTFFSRLDKE